MSLKKFSFFFGLFLLIISAGAINAQEADLNFNPAYIIGDEDVLDSDSMALEEIKLFLRNKGGYLANYSCANPDGKTMTAAEIIHDRAITNGVSPKFIIVLLQKEQSLIEDASPKQSQLDWATGYGCPDGGSCNTRWQGFWKQVNSASLQFRDYMDNPGLYTYQTGQTYTFKNLYSTTVDGEVVVTPINQATAALYNYTPHVYNGNYNFYKIWQRYFTKTYPDGSLLQGQGQPGVWLIKNGEKHPFLSRGALTSRFNANMIIMVSPTDLDRYPTGSPVKFPQYSVVLAPNGSIYLLVDDQKRKFSDGEAFRAVGINPEEIVNANWDDLAYYSDGALITASSTNATGALLQNKKTGGVYYALGDEKHAIWDKIFLTVKFKNKKIIPVAPEELDKYANGEPVKFNDGALIKAANLPGVYVISNGQRRPITSAKTFEGLGYKWENIISVPEKILTLHEVGEPLALETY